MDDKGLSRSQIVYTALKDMIREGTLRPGQRMREIEIAEAQGVSRTPVREAMNRLVSEGLLEVSSARGVAVTELSKQQVLEIYAASRISRRCVRPLRGAACVAAGNALAAGTGSTTP